MNFTPVGLFKVDHLRYTKIWLAIGMMFLCIIVIASVIDISPTVKSVMLHDKITHLIAYAILMGWFSQIFRHDLTRLLLAVLLATLGIGVEFLQSLTPTRQFEYLDMIANASGVLLAWALSYTWFGTVLERVERIFFGRTQTVV